MEIERKFLVTDISHLKLETYKSKKIIQDYLYNDKITTIRKRCIIQDDKEKYIYTVKTGRVNYSINEIESEITKKQYDKLGLNPKCRTIEKIRYNIPYENGLIIELDVFEGEYKGIVFAEIEFESEEQAENTNFPEWFGKELTGKLSNGMMARKKVEDIKRNYKQIEVKTIKENYNYNKILVQILEQEKAILKYPKCNIEVKSYIGRNGATEQKQEGDGKTPLGEFELGVILGTKIGIQNKNGLEYKKIMKEMYWVDDINSKYYNQLVNENEVEKDWNSAEHLIEYPIEYKYLVEIKTNTKNISGKGSAVFLHCSNNKPTAGCIAVDANSMRTIIENIDQNTKIEIKKKSVRRKYMVKSKGWNWKILKENEEEVWKNPSIESYYLLNRWKSQGKEKFLDLGCGLGRHSILFGKNEFEVNCFDISQEAIERTKEWAETENLKFNYKVGDMLELPYENKQFDCIYCRNVISHTDTEGMKKVIKELNRVMKDDAECYLTLGSKDTWGFKQEDWPLIDQNTRLRMDEGPEYKIPHFYVDYDLIKVLFNDFEIVNVYQVVDYYEKNGKTNDSYHYHILIHKK